MIDFNNTEIAFKYKTDKSLRRAYRLFKIVRYPWLVSLGKKVVPIAFKFRLPIIGLIKATIFKQFCGGETIDDCDETIAILHKHNVGTILDYSVEGKIEEDDFDATCDEIVATIIKSKGNPAIPFAVFKVTGISRHGLLEKLNDVENELTEKERQEFADVFKRVDKICGKAHELGTPVFIDAEESWIQNTIDRLAESMITKYNKEKTIVYNTVQLYRHDRLVYFKEQVDKGIREGYTFAAKLVRGAYMEKERDRAAAMGYPSPIQPDKVSCDNDYNAALRFAVDNIENCAICCGTHNEESNMLLTELMKEKGIDKSDRRMNFAQLLGMSDHISYNLAHHGYFVAKYVPYGPVKEVMPYLLRRADENTSVAGQTGRELSLLSREWKRRKGG
jgi:proline dehydrogenase